MQRRYKACLFDLRTPVQCFSLKPSVHLMSKVFQGPLLQSSHNRLHRLTVAHWKHPHDLHSQTLLATGVLSSTLEVRTPEVQRG